ncbi:MAG: penicillin-binding protein 2 [Rhodobacteraceae bacterium]|nr:penicillin-binding protein 2 [Paracoccaceae bacterium]
MRRSPQDSRDSALRISRRALVLFGVQAAAVGALGMRMHQLQMVETDRFRLLAEENRIALRLIPPARGPILDRNGIVLAENEQNYRIIIVREEARDVPAVLERLSRIVPLDEDARERVLRDVMRRRPFVPVTVLDRLDWDQVAAVAINAPALPGITADMGLSRIYPLHHDTAHVVGYVGPVSDADLRRADDQDPILQYPKFQIGKVGVEARLDRDLRGRAGSRRIEVNAVGRVMRELERHEGTQGATVRMTLDAQLQNYAQARLGEESASAVVMDVHSGDILAMASAPSFDPNLFVEGISVADFRALLDNPFRPLATKTVQGTYPPGSTFKMVVALAAVADGLVSPDETVFCPGHYDTAGRRFHCWKRGGHGRMNLRDALSESCDTYFYDIAQRVGIDRIAEVSELLGLGLRHDLPLSGIAAGLNPNRAWKQRVHGQAWRVGDTINAGIGQGYVLSSPVQLAVMTARLATGRKVAPRLVRAIDGAEEPVPEAEALGFSEAFLAQMRAGMYDCVNRRSGTAYASRIALREVAMSGKTGTSQVRNISAAERATGVLRTDQLPWERRNHALFVAFAPHDAPRYAVSVVVEHGGSGSGTAAPIARDIMIETLFEGAPPIEAWPTEQRGRAERLRRELNLRDFSPGAGAGRTRA